MRTLKNNIIFHDLVGYCYSTTEMQCLWLLVVNIKCTTVVTADLKVKMFSLTLVKIKVLNRIIFTENSR